MGGERSCASESEIASYIDGQVSERGLESLEAHLDACSACARLAIEVARATCAEAPGPERERPSIFRIDQVIAGRYRILAFLGAGGMGEVYEAQDTELGEKVALKTVSAAATFDAKAVARLKAEVLLARKVTHRNVCRIFDFGVHSDVAAARDGRVATTPFLTMELLEGRTLADRIRGGDPFSTESALDIARQLASGLLAAHEAGIIHRDLKSDNVLLLSAPVGAVRAVITDFGLAGSVRAEAEQQAMSAGGALYGTPLYLAPERAAGGPGTKAADVYAFGVVLGEMVTGSMASRWARPLAPGDFAPVASPLVPVIQRCLDPSPGTRPGAAADVLAILDECVPPRRHSVRGAPGRLRARAALAAVGSLALVAAWAALGARAPRADRSPPPPVLAAPVPALAAPVSPRAAPASPTVRPAPPLPARREARRWRPPAAPVPVLAVQPPHVRAAAVAPPVPDPVVRPASPAPAPPAPAAVEPPGSPDEPIRSLAPAAVRPRALDQDAPIDPFRR
jgi:hypothetical protein